MQTGGLNEHCSFYSLEQSFTITKVLSQKQIKSINLDGIKSGSKEKRQPPSKNADDASDVHLWRKGTTLITGDSILYGIDEKKICQNGSVKVRVFPGATIEDLKDCYIKPLLRKQPSKVILHVSFHFISFYNIYTG